MTFCANLAPPPAAARPPRTAHRARAGGRRSFDLGRGQADDHVVARLQLAADDLRVVAVGNARPDPDGLRLLRGRIEDVDLLAWTAHTAATAAALERAARAAGAGDAGAAARLGHAPFRIRAAGARRRRAAALRPL